MITENHTQEFIEYWLKLWVRLGALPPGEAVSDYERAIPMSCCLTFNNMSLKAYVDTCLLWATSDETRKPQRPVNTLIRIDIAHLMHLASCWKSVKNEKHPAIKNTRLYCVALMVDSKTVKRFSRIFLLTNIISLHPYLDTVMNIDGISMTVSNALTELQNAISERREIINSFEESMISYEENKKDNNASPGFEEGENGTLTHQFIKKLIHQARPSSSDVIGTQINAFYNEEFTKDLERLGKEFPLWTGIMRPNSDQHASSAHQEGYFAYLRNTIFEYISLPCSADRFISEHIQSTKSGTNVLAAELKHSSHQRKLYSPPSQERQRQNNNPLYDDLELLQPPLKKPHMFDDSDLRTYEPWGGLKNENPNHVINESWPEDVSPTEQEKLVPSKIKESIITTTYNTSTILAEEFEHGILSDIIAGELTISYDGIVQMAMMESAAPPNDDTMTNQYYEYRQKSSSSTIDFDFNSPARYFNKITCNNLLTSTPLMEHSYAQYALFDNEKLLQDVECTSPKSQSHRQELLDAGIQIIENKENLPINQQNRIGEYDWSQKDKENVEADCQSERKQKKIMNVKNEKIAKPKGFYFQPNREIKVAVNRPANKKGLLLPNGNTLKKLNAIKRAEKYPYIFEHNEEHQLIRSRDIKIRLLNTCGFDSIVHILQFSAIDYDEYNKFIGESRNLTLKFIKRFMKNGATADILLERLKLINKFHPIRKNEMSLNPYYINAENCIVSIWDNHFQHEPSAFKTYTCSNNKCPGKEMIKSSHFNVNENVIRKEGYGALRQALLYNSHINIKCRQLQCTGLLEETTTLNMHICIELDVRESKNRSATKECCLKDFPQTLELEETFQLAGVVHHDPNTKHFTAYCLRTSGLWTHCDDMKTSINYKCKDTILVKPHIIIYVKSSQFE